MNYSAWFDELYESGRLISEQEMRGISMVISKRYRLGYLHGEKRVNLGETVVEMCLYAESLLSEGNKESAAVLTAAALEDCFKQKADENGLNTTNKTLPNHISALKSKGMLSGATLKRVAGYSRFWNAVMQADWEAIDDAGIIGICDFLKTFAVQ